MASMARGDAARSATGAIVTGARERRAMAVRVVLFKTTRISSPPTSTSAAATDAVQHNAQPEQFKTTRLSNHEVFATFLGLSTVPQTVASIFSQVKQLNTSLFLCIRMGMGVVSTSYEYGWSGGCSPRRVQFGTSEQAAAGAAGRRRPARVVCGRARDCPGRCRGLSSGLGRGAAPPGTRQVRRSDTAPPRRSQIHTACRRRSTDKQETSDFYLFRTE